MTPRDAPRTPSRATSRVLATGILLLAGVHLLGGGLGLAGCGDPVPPAPGAGNGDAGHPDAGRAVATGVPAGPDLAVDPAWLAAHLDDAGLQIVDTRPAVEHEAARIPGAILIAVESIVTTAAGVENEVPARPDLQAALAAAGLDRTRTAVVYGDAIDIAAGRVLWTLAYAGHPSVRIVDGGFARWKAEGYPVETTPSAAAPSSYAIGALTESLRVDKEWVRAHLGDPGVRFVDARSAAEYRQGHLPGALNVEWTANVPDGSFAARDAVAALYPGFDPQATTVITYCRTGTRATVAFVALKWLGFVDVRVYDGSWIEWSALDPAAYPREP